MRQSWLVILMHLSTKSLPLVHAPYCCATLGTSLVVNLSPLVFIWFIASKYYGIFYTFSFVIKSIQTMIKDLPRKYSCMHLDTTQNTAISTIIDYRNQIREEE